MSARKVALVTGSATGIGRALAWQLAERGIDVVINYSRSEKEAVEAADGVRQRGADVRIERCDVSDESRVAEMVERVRNAWGGIDYLINNAATTYFVDLADLEGMSADKWDRIFAVNVKGAFFCFRSAQPSLLERQGAVVNVSSVAALTGFGSSMAYAASKAALLNMTRSWAKAFAPRIRINAVLPGPVDTRWLMDGHADMVEAFRERTPMKRVSSADDVAAAIRFFLLDTDFITGHWVVVDGGLTMP